MNGCVAGMDSDSEVESLVLLRDGTSFYTKSSKSDACCECEKESDLTLSDSSASDEDYDADDEQEEKFDCDSPILGGLSPANNLGILMATKYMEDDTQKLVNIRDRGAL
eukprot:gene5690-10936_t